MILENTAIGGVCLIGFAIMIIVGVAIYYYLEGKKATDLNKWRGYEYKRTCKNCGSIWYSDYINEKELADIAYKPSQVSARSANVVNREMEESKTKLYNLRRCPKCFSGNYDETGGFTHGNKN